MVLIRSLFLLIFITVALAQDVEDPEPDATQSELDDQAIVSSVMYAPVPTNRIAVNRHQLPPPEYIATSGEQKTVCKNHRTDFSKDTTGWQVENSMQDTYDIISNGLQFHLLSPSKYIRMHDQNNLPYNEIGGRGPTLNATSYMRYGRVSATLRSAGTGGAVTAFILMADGGDEIDFEFLGGDKDLVQSNYFWGQSKEYNVNGGIHKVEGGHIDTTFHKYTIDWKPDRIEWLVDDKVVRTRIRSETCDATGVCKFPSQPARVQFGLWDGSIESGTAEWSKGPIDWSAPQHGIQAFIKSVQVDCNPEYNQIVN
ncbi:Glycoside hydrolase, 38 vacuolar alpha mannosidase [Mucor velutinosus]|uniref:Glycoside hydrolase, 38 vacuolar alpha mannosidase n=1 Tax=Mucor velutinosus TaxID=708070 RepID=A0AAN7D7R2_9FUNG|nr:Glycoside hydrolase, 38 vacuolar alpha mannosidase [Mucor velutinosus]